MTSQVLTFFTIPKAFTGHAGLIQANALRSWCRLDPRPEIILYGNDAGVAEAAAAFGVVHEPVVGTNRHGTPLVSDAFKCASRAARSNVLIFSNADMLYDESLLQTASALQFQPKFLASGQRWDLNVVQSLDGAGPEIWRTLFAGRKETARLHGMSGMDYFMFPRTLPLEMPEFAVGRVGWDNWLVWHCRMTGVPVIDVTGSVAALHQNHDYSHTKLGGQHVYGPERDLNVRAAGGLSHMLTLREADWRLVNGRLARPPWPRRFFALLGRTSIYQRTLALKRALSYR